MDGNTRRQALLKQLREESGPISGQRLAKLFGVSRQVIVQDIALLRAADHPILATSRGYLYEGSQEAVRVFHVNHTEWEIEEEMNIVADFGGTMVDVFVEHESYGELRASLNVRTRKQVQEFVEGIRSGTSGPLMTVTSGDHYHTVKAASEETLDEIEAELLKHGFLKP